MSFGYGVGDFITVATIAWKISLALRSTKGASESYNALIQELESTAQSLYQTGKLLETAGLPASTANCINHGLSLCHGNLLRLRAIVKEYQKSFETPKMLPAKQRDWHSLWGMKAQLKKISWEMCEKEGVNEIRQNIKSGVAEITLILQACGLNEIRETRAIVKRVEAALPRDLGYTWEWDHKVIYLDDALGRSIPIPFEACLQWETFNEMLKLVFRDRPGISQINAGQFTIKTQRYKLLSPTEWDHIVKPSMTLFMSIVLRKDWSVLSRCPLCNTHHHKYSYIPNPGYDLEQVQCTKCFIWYSVSRKPRITELEMAGDIAYSRNSESYQSKEGQMEVEEEDIRAFKRVDVVVAPSLESLFPLGHPALEAYRQELELMHKKRLLGTRLGI